MRPSKAGRLRNNISSDAIVGRTARKKSLIDKLSRASSVTRLADYCPFCSGGCQLQDAPRCEYLRGRGAVGISRGRGGNRNGRCLNVQVDQSGESNDVDDKLKFLMPLWRWASLRFGPFEH